MENQIAFGIVGAGIGLYLIKKIVSRLQLSKAKHPSLAGHSRMAKRVARLIPYYTFNQTSFFNADNAPTEISTLRQTGFERLADIFKKRFIKSIALTSEAAQIYQIYSLPPAIECHFNLMPM